MTDPCSCSSGACAGNSLIGSSCAWAESTLTCILGLPLVALGVGLGHHCTGSQLDADGLKYYTILARSAGHTGSALGMMANWDLQGLARQLPELKPKLLLVTASNDRMIPPSDGKRAQALVADSELHEMQGLGHLAHEEQPADIAKLIFDFYDRITK